MRSFLAGMTAAARRLSGAWSLGAFSVAALVAATAALLERGAAPGRAVDYTLAGAVFGWLVPLLSYAAVGRVARDGRVDLSVRALSRHGANRRAAALGVVTVAALRSATVLAFGAIVAVLTACARVDLPALSDALTSGWIAALGGAVYACWFSLGSLFGRSGQGRAVCLALDWLLGTTGVVASLPWPRAHLHSLIGGELVAGLSEGQSALSLYAIAAVCLVLFSLRVPP